MAQQTTAGIQKRQTAGNDVFTALLIIAFVVAVAAMVFVILRSDELFETAVPGIPG